MQHFPQSYYRQSDFLTCVLTREIRQECLDSSIPNIKHQTTQELAPWPLLVYYTGVYSYKLRVRNVI